MMGLHVSGHYVCKVLQNCDTSERQGWSPSQGLEGRQEDPHLNYRAAPAVTFEDEDSKFLVPSIKKPN